MNQQTCNRAWLDAFLTNDLDEREEQMLTSHLDECSDCREELEGRAAERSVWREASSLLGGSVLHSSDAIGDLRSGSAHSPQIALVLQQLAPTDDPESMGRIGGYEVTGVVGAGGMGVVLKAHDRSLDRIVAVKVMSPHLASSGSARKRFAREAKAAAAVLHPNVIAIHSVASEEASPFLVMPFVRGASLQKRIDSQGPLPLKDTLRIGAQIAAGLAAAHEQGLVHRDIKPANILLEEGVERVTITDFGLARAVDDASMTCSGVIAGTPQYMSPEQARGEPIDARSDLFSLGGVLYAMCTGRSPFRAETTYGVLHRIANDKPTPVCEVNTDVPVWLGHVIGRLMAKRPEDRFESAAHVAELLEGCLAHVQQPAAIPLPEAVTALAPKKTRRPPIGKLIVAAAFVLAFMFAGVFVVLELDKGTLTIQSDVDDIRVRITRGDELIDELTVTKTGQSVRVAAGQYNVEVIGETDDLTVENGQVSLHRAGVEVVRIVNNPNNGAATRTTAKNLSADQWLDKLQGNWNIVQQHFDDGVPKRNLYSATVHGNRMEIVRENGQSPLTFDLVIGEVGPPQQIDLVIAMSDRERQAMLEDWGDVDEPLPVPILKGIIEVDGDLISICSPSAADSQRPIEFLSGEEQLMWNFTRPGAGSLANVSPSKSSPELPPVKIVVHDEEGKPLEGVKVSLFQLAKDQGGQVLEINETSNASGLSVNRNLPYGHYELSATTPDGWYLTGYRSRLNVEFEKGVDVVLVAPTPSKTSKLVFSSDIKALPEKISGLRFGQLREGNFTAYAPEPEWSNSNREREFESFPTIINGIEYIGAEIRLEISRTIPQPAPSLQDVNSRWNWTPAPNSQVNSRYLIANGQARRFEQGLSEDNVLARVPVDGSEFFKLPSSKHCVGASMLKLGEPTELPLELDIPTGNVKVTIGRFLGKPNAKVMDALSIQSQTQQPELWLEAMIAADSAWVERLINMEWLNSPIRGSGGATFPLLWREQTLRPGERLEIPLAMKQAPAPPSLGKTLQLLQGKWRLLRQIDHDGSKRSMPSQTVWEFKGNRYVAGYSGPAGLIDVDDSQSPVHVKWTILNDRRSGLGLLSIEGDKAVFCMGKPQEAPDPSSRPEKLQWVEGAFYMELTRMRPGDTVAPLKPEFESPVSRSSPIEAVTPNPAIATESKSPAIDYRNARSVVEAYVASALAGDVAKAASLAKNSPADHKHIRELPEFLNIQRLKIETVYVNDPAKPTQALATSEAVKLEEEHKNPDGRRDGFMVFTLELTDEKWFVIDIDFETESGAEKELNKFLKANPNSIGIPPQS